MLLTRECLTFTTAAGNCGGKWERMRERMRDTITFEAGGARASLRPSEVPGRPLVVLNSYEDDGGGVAAALAELGAPDCSLLTVYGLDWDRDMSPWPAPGVDRNGPPFPGDAEAYLRRLLEEILPEACARLPYAPGDICIAGYSLAGLFALWSLFRCQIFSRAACVSGSLWYPGAAEFFRDRVPVRLPDRLYLSLGDREAAVRHPLLRTVRERTEETAGRFRTLGVPVTLEWNPGNHFREPERRTAKGIQAMLTEAAEQT